MYHMGYAELPGVALPAEKEFKEEDLTDMHIDKTNDIAKHSY